MIGGAAFLLGLCGLLAANTMDRAERAHAAAYRPEKISYRQCVIHEVVCQSGAMYNSERKIWRLAKDEKLTIQEAEELATEIQCRKEGIPYRAPKFNDIFLSYKDICGKVIGREEAIQILKARNEKNTTNENKRDS